MMKMQIFKIRIRLFMIREMVLNTYPARVILCTSFDEVKRLYKSFNLECETKGAAFVEPLTCPVLGSFYVIAFANHEIALDNVIMVHELIHLKNLITEDAGVFNDTNNDEPEAYYYMYLFDTLTQAVRFEDVPEIIICDSLVLEHLQEFESKITQNPTPV